MNWQRAYPQCFARPSWHCSHSIGGGVGFLPWPALVRTHGDFFRVGIYRHVVQRGFESFEGHGAFAPYFYLVTAVFSLFPWIGCAGFGIMAVRRNWNTKNAFLLAWVAGTYLLFT